MESLQIIMDKYNDTFYTTADQRSLNWLFMGGPGPILAISISYLYFCLSFGPRIMKNRRPFELKTAVMLYNIFQILLSIFLVYQGSMYMLTKDYKFACEPVDYSDTPRGVWGASASWWYLFAKITELIDTVFFVLRKKNSQVSFLHVYHHTIMSLLVWIGVKYFPCGHSVLLGTMNSFVHVIMYTYYLISGLGPEYQKYVWWKKHVTLLQLVQFAIVLYHNASVLFIDCAYPRAANIMICINSILFIYLFGKFYINSYKKDNYKKMKHETLKKNTVKKENKKNILDYIFNC
ncbi:hypothetical protein K1T71_004728 [Dendrolimus kikuchii]|uniref:Uncharacterized protein n=1 Tax=Dendrolimus kikuchii TaxID=765133 RepID=A0ACC1D8E4_9NEOP|nr:hypothetical protein K1T71_004728 [Dendrolimus kikuchii]